MFTTKFFNQSVVAAFLLLCTMTHISCKKKSHFPPDNDEVNATVTFSSGIVLNTRTTGMNARMGCDIYGITSFVESNDENNGRITVFSLGRCIMAPETRDSIHVEYNRYPNSQTSPIYGNTIIRTPGGRVEYSGRLTFTVVNGDYWEGNFNAVCWSFQAADSVIISGTFKGTKR